LRDNGKAILVDGSWSLDNIGDDSSAGGSSQALVDNFKQMRVLQSGCDSLLVIQLLVHGMLTLVCTLPYRDIDLQ